MEFTARIEMDNAAFADAPFAELENILRKIIADMVEGGCITGAPLYDINGNFVGQWRIDKD